MGGKFTVEVRRPKACPSWMWRLNVPSGTMIEIAEEHPDSAGVLDEAGLLRYDVRMGPGPAWGEAEEYEIGDRGGQVRICHVLQGSVQTAVAEVSPGDHLIYQAPWLPRRLRKVTPVKRTP